MSRRDLFMRKKAAAGGGFDFGNALQFDAIGYVSLSMASYNQWSFVLWFKPVADLQFLAGAGTGTSFIRYDDDSTIRLRQSTNNTINFPAGTMPLNQWSCIVVTMDNGSGNVMANGVQSLDGPKAYTNLGWNMSYFGRRATAGSEFEGVMDEAAFYPNTILTLTNAQDMYNAGAGVSLSDVVSIPAGGAHWDFNQDLRSLSLPDISGNGNNGTLTNFSLNDGRLISFPASGMWVAGKIGNGLDFDGVDDYVIFDQNAGNDTWAFSVWVKSPDVSTVNCGLIGNGALSNKYIHINNASNRIIVREADGTQVFFTGFTFSDNTWYHIVVSSDNLNCRCWVNGVESTAGTLAISTTFGAPNQFSTIGLSKVNWGSGVFDLLGLWYGDYLTPADVATLYNAGAGVEPQTVKQESMWFGSNFNGSGTDTDAINETPNIWITH